MVKKIKTLIFSVILCIVFISGCVDSDSSDTYSDYENSSFNAYLTDYTSDSESDYKNSCKSISFKALEKNPEKYVGQRVKFSGSIFQIMENSGLTDIILTDSNSGENIYLFFDGTTSALEDDSITVYGEVYGSYTYESQANYQITLPAITVKYIEL